MRSLEIEREGGQELAKKKKGRKQEKMGVGNRGKTNSLRLKKNEQLRTFWLLAKVSSERNVFLVNL